MPLDAPFRLGPFIVDTHGRLQPEEPDRFPNFHFVWRGCPVHARLDAGAGPERAPAQLVLSAIVGRVPSTAGGDAGHNRTRRIATFGALADLNSDAAGAPRLRLLADHRLTIAATRKLAMPVSAGDLLTQITCCVLDLSPYLDLLEEAEVPVETVGATPSSGGTAKT